MYKLMLSTLLLKYSGLFALDHRACRFLCASICSQSTNPRYTPTYNTVARVAVAAAAARAVAQKEAKDHHAPQNDKIK